LDRSFDSYDDIKLYPQKNYFKICENIPANRYESFQLTTTKKINIGKLKPEDQTYFNLREIIDYTFPKTFVEDHSIFNIRPTRNARKFE
jgi:hypothetical protein